MRTIKLLLVDDEREFREATGRALSRRGYEVSLAASGREALERLASGTPDVVVLDLRMDGMDGIETLKEIRAVSPRLPVVILTGHGGLGDALAGIQLDVVDFLQKPVGMDRLAARIRSLLNREGGAPLRERTVAELMTPAAAYRRIREDRPARELLELLRGSVLEQQGGEETAGRTPRSVLVVDREGRFVGVAGAATVMTLLIPMALRDSPYASYFTGMFLARCKLVGNTPMGDLPLERRTIDLGAPLMEAVAMLTAGGLTCLPVLRDGELAGVLRRRDLVLEAASLVV